MILLATSVYSDVALITHNSFMDDPLIPIPLHDRLNNQHLYTCRKEGKREPLICSVVDNPTPLSYLCNVPSLSASPDYGYSVQGVFDPSRKTDTDWSLRRFDSIVSSFCNHKICSASNLKEYFGFLVCNHNYTDCAANDNEF